MVASDYYDFLIPPFDRKDLADMMEKNLFPTVEGLYPALGYAIFFGIARIILTHFVFQPMARFCMKIPNSSFHTSKDIESKINSLGLAKKKKVSEEELNKLVDATGLKVDAVTRYLFSKYNDKVNSLKVTKFVEAFWRFLFYSYFVYLGFNILIYPTPVPYILDPKYLYINWPHQVVSDAIIYYHHVQLGCYIHQLMWTEVSRSDSLEMMLHHVVTISLVLISHLIKFHYTGAVTFFVHDVADIFLEGGKCVVYSSKVKSQAYLENLANVLFACFAITFFISRLVVFPRLIVYGLAAHSGEILGYWPGYYIITGLFFALLGLHIFWYYLISRMIIKLFSGGISKDVRSDDEDDLPNPDSVISRKKKHT